MTSRMTMVSEE